MEKKEREGDQDRSQNAGNYVDGRRGLRRGDGRGQFDRARLCWIGDTTHRAPRGGLRRFRRDDFSKAHTMDSVLTVAGVPRGVAPAATKVPDAIGHGHFHRDAPGLQSHYSRVVIGGRHEAYDDHGDEGKEQYRPGDEPKSAAKTLRLRTSKERGFTRIGRAVHDVHLRTEERPRRVVAGARFKVIASRRCDAVTRS